MKQNSAPVSISEPESFGTAVKRELSGLEISRGKSECIAELYGVFLFCNRFDSNEIRIATRSAEFARRLMLLMKRGFRTGFDEVFDRSNSKGRTVLQIRDPKKLECIMNTYGISAETLLSHHINFAVLENETSRCAFYRGAFLTTGSVTDPKKRYHLEIATHHASVSRELQSLMMESELSPRLTKRKSVYVTYFKQAEAISDFLTMIGAPVASMEIMNAQAEKVLRNRVNRQVNCEEANLDKVIDASISQVESIQKLIESGRFDGLPEVLKETAQIRLKNPSDSLNELCGKFPHPISKSTLNHRLRRLIDLAAQAGA